MENVFDDLLSLKDAADLWHLEESTIRKAIANEKFTNNVEVKKFGKQWVISKKAMQRVYGYLYNDQIVEEEISDTKKRQIYYYISECFVAYAKKYKMDFNKVNKEFVKHGIIDYIYDCYDYLHLQNTNSTVIDIRSRIKRGVNYA